MMFPNFLTPAPRGEHDIPSKAGRCCCGSIFPPSSIVLALEDVSTSPSHGRPRGGARSPGAHREEARGDGNRAACAQATSRCDTQMARVQVPSLCSCMPQAWECELSPCCTVAILLSPHALRHILCTAWKGNMTVAVVTPQQFILPLLLCTGNFVMTVRTGNLLYTSGHLPISLEGDMTIGKVSCSLSICCS